MRNAIWAAIAALIVTTGCGRAEVLPDADEIIAMERAALDRWGNGDPQRYP